MPWQRVGHLEPVLRRTSFVAGEETAELPLRDHDGSLELGPSGHRTFTSRDRAREARE